MPFLFSLNLSTDMQKLLCHCSCLLAAINSIYFAINRIYILTTSDRWSVLRFSHSRCKWFLIPSERTADFTWTSWRKSRTLFYLDRSNFLLIQSTRTRLFNLMKTTMMLQPQSGLNYHISELSSWLVMQHSFGLTSRNDWGADFKSIPPWWAWKAGTATTALRS